jgi:hypothetical protein
LRAAQLCTTFLNIYRFSYSHDPVNVTLLMREVWMERGRSVGMKFDICDCPYTAEELTALDTKDRRVAFLPEELATQRGRASFAAMFPEMQCYSLLPDNVVSNDDDPFGWFDYEASIDAPRLDTDERSLVKCLAAEALTLLTLNQYIVASQDTKALTGTYLDERRSWTRIGSRVDGRITCARFDGETMAEGLGDEEPVEGSLLLAYDVGEHDRGPVLGGRATSLSPHRQLTSPRPVSQGRTPRVGRPVDLESEWRRQVDAKLEAGFPAALRVSVDEYIASLPRPDPQPSEYRDRFDVPILVETRLSWQVQAALANVQLSNHSRRTMYRPVDARSETPGGPYWAWFSHWAQRFPEPVSPSDARAELGPDEVGGSVHELVALHLAHPELNEQGKFLEAIGHVMEPVTVEGLSSEVPADRTPCMYRWRQRAEVGANLHPIGYSLFRPLVRGTRIATR